MNKNRETYDLMLKVIRITDKAVLVTEEMLDADGKQINYWLPRSQIIGVLEKDTYCHIEIPAWLLEKTGLTV